ncbi:MAG: site-2 protease family protein [Chlamydiota bacterium]
MGLVYLVLAAFGLGFLVFIHELGHYFVARAKGMKVEAFGIGFGKPIRTWEHKGVKWNLCWLPFGGYVKIAGMEKQGALEPHEIKEGFFSKTPWARIQVLVAGPVVNIVFAFLAFTMIWMAGGRLKPFAEFTHRIGWVDADSKLYAQGIRPGDEIVSYNGTPFKGFNDLLYASFLDNKPADLKGFEIDYWTNAKRSFDFMIDPTQDLKGMNPKLHVLGILAPAGFLMFEKYFDGSPMEGSGIQKNDRIFWIDGQLVFSQIQMKQVINEERALLTVQRKDKIFLSRVPRLKISDLRISNTAKAELSDWQHEAGLSNKVNDLYFIPYNMSNSGVIESAYAYMGEDSEEHVFESTPRAHFDVPLRQGDKILAVDGTPIASAFDLMKKVQDRRIHIVVQREPSRERPLWKDADSQFDANIDWDALQRMVFSIGTAKPVDQAGNLLLLKPISPKPLHVMGQDPDKTEWYEDRLKSAREQIEAIKDPKLRARAERELEEETHQLMLGITLLDRGVIYNPPPTTLFYDVFKDTWRTLKALVTGYLNPKLLQGPIGIVQVIQYGWSVGIKEAIYWMGMISLNLGILNLLPIPMLDGGYICFSLVEVVRKKPIKSKTMERLIIPFLVVIIAFFIYVTYNDLSRLFHRFF